jgi:hypothetical protein
MRIRTRSRLHDNRRNGTSQRGRLDADSDPESPARLQPLAASSEPPHPSVSRYLTLDAPDRPTLRTGGARTIVASF